MTAQKREEENWGDLRGTPTLSTVSTYSPRSIIFCQTGEMHRVIMETTNAVTCSLCRDVVVTSDVCACMLSCFSHVWLFATLWTVAHQAALSMGFFRQWVAISSSRGSSRHRDWTCVSCISWIGRWILYHCTSWEAPCVSGDMEMILRKAFFSESSRLTFRQTKKSKCIITWFTPCMRFKPDAKGTRNVL